VASLFNHSTDAKHLILGVELFFLREFGSSKKQARKTAQGSGCEYHPPLNWKKTRSDVRPIFWASLEIKLFGVW